MSSHKGGDDKVYSHSTRKQSYDPLLTCSTFQLVS